jgi:uncharacterized iron-regulated protein
MRARGPGSGCGRAAPWLLLVLAVASGCRGATGAGSLHPSSPAGERLVIPRDADPEAAARLVAERARSAEVIYLGELHDNPDHHAIQARVLRALLAAGSRPVLALEMVPEVRQAELEAAVRGEGGPEEVGRQLQWRARGWPDFGMYWPLIELARRHGLPVLAADLDPAVTRRINRGGLGAAGEDPARLRSAIPDDPRRDRAITRRIQVAHCGLVPESRAARMLESWYARNVVIARRLGEALGSARQVVVIIGGGHQSQGGVPEQLAALRPGTRQFVVALVEGGDPSPDPGANRPGADVVWLTPARERPDYCRGLRERLG